MRYLQAFLDSMDLHQLDAVVYPTWNRQPLLVGQPSDGYDGNNSPMIAPHVGAPALTVPMGETGAGRCSSRSTHSPGSLGT